MTLGAWRRAARRAAVKLGVSLMEFALVNDRLFVAVYELDGIFDGDDVVGLRFVDAVENRSHSGGFAGAGGSSDQNDSVFEVGDLAELRGQFQLREGGSGLGNHAHHDRVASALHEDVDAEAAVSGKAVRKVAGALLLQGAERLFVARHEFQRNAVRVVG